MSCSTSVVEIEFTEEDFSGRERGSNPRVSVVVFKDKQIATRIVLHVVPLTLAEAQSFFLPLPANILNINNTLSPPYAGNTCACTNLYAVAVKCSCINSRF